MKFSLNLYVDGQAEELIEFVKHAEAAGFDRVWTQEGEFYRAGYDGQHEPATADLAPPPSIHLGVLGPQMSVIAGQVADGLLAGVMGTPRWLRDVVWPGVRRGQETAGRRGSDFEMTG